MVDGTVRNPAVDAAYTKGEYTDKKGLTYRRGMDGWFAKMGITYVGAKQEPQPILMLVRHHDMADLIAREAEETEADNGGE